MRTILFAAILSMSACAKKEADQASAGDGPGNAAKTTDTWAGGRGGAAGAGGTIQVENTGGGTVKVENIPGATVTVNGKTVEVPAGGTVTIGAGDGISVGHLVGSGVVKEDARTLADFSGVVSAGAWDVTWRAGAKPGAVVRGDDNLVAQVTTTVAGNQLRIESKGSFTTKAPLTVEVTSAKLESVQLTGSGDFVAHEVAGESFKAAIDGAGDVMATGKVGAVSVASNGAGNVDLAKLSARSANVHLTGSGEVAVFASDLAEVGSAGPGKVTVHGKPKTINKNITGSGSVEQL